MKPIRCAARVVLGQTDQTAKPIIRPEAPEKQKGSAANEMKTRTFTASSYLYNLAPNYAAWGCSNPNRIRECRASVAPGREHQQACEDEASASGVLISNARSADRRGQRLLVGRHARLGRWARPRERAGRGGCPRGSGSGSRSGGGNGPNTPSLLLSSIVPAPGSRARGTAVPRAWRQHCPMTLAINALRSPGAQTAVNCDNVCSAGQLASQFTHVRSGSSSAAAWQYY